ncbi:MAG: hypothetical protein LBH00_05600 [Planctomycetaceae bacterium]|jgi:hypothetical protein|nr:hypothetical protein [Planctomycetaceae bacterium]
MYRTTAVLFLLLIAAVNTGTVWHFCETFTWDRFSTFRHQLSGTAKEVRTSTAADGKDSPQRQQEHQLQVFFNKIQRSPLKRYGVQAESVLNASTAENRWLINLFGFLQKAMGKNMVDNAGSYICKRPNGNLVYGHIRKKQISDKNTPETLRKNLRPVCDLFRKLQRQNTPYLYILSPERIPPDTCEILPGIVNHVNESMDAQVQVLQENGVPVLDLRSEFRKHTQNWDDLFFHTDHHWQVPSGFLAAAQIIRIIKDTLKLPEDRVLFLTDIQNYETITEPKSFLGSLGTRTGETYCGLDDFVYYVPKFTTHLKRSAVKRGGEPKLFEGTFQECLVFPSRKKFFRYDDTYFDGNIGYQTIDNAEGSGSVLVIHNSMAQAVLPFFALHFRHLVCIDPRYSYTKTIDELLQEEHFDYVITLY